MYFEPMESKHILLNTGLATHRGMAVGWVVGTELATGTVAVNLTEGFEITHDI